MQLLSKLRNYLLFVQAPVILLAQPPLSPGEEMCWVTSDLENRVQCSLFILSVQCPEFSLQFSGFSVQCSVFSVYLLSSVQCSVSCV